MLLGMSVEVANETAARYQFQAIEFKETAHRADGVFLPKEAGLPVYFLEVQFYSLPSVFADLLAKVFTYLKQHNPAQDFVGVVLFATRSLEPPEAAVYRLFFDAGLIRRFYLDEMPELANAPLGLSILYLIRQAESGAPGIARDLVARAKREIPDAALRADLIELIETVVIYKLPRLGREEIQAMLKVQDIRETRVYQEAFEDGEKNATARAIMKLAAKKLPAEEIASLLEVNIQVVRDVLTGRAND